MLGKIDLFTVFFSTFKLTPHHTNVCKSSRMLRSCIFVTFQQITLKLRNFINFKALFYVVSTDFPELSIHVKS